MATATPDILDELVNKPDHEITLKVILEGIREARNSITARLDVLESRLGELDDLKQEVRELKEDYSNTKKVVENLVASEDPFPPNLSLLVLNMPKEDDEDEVSLRQNVTDVIQDGLELQDVVIDAVERAPARSYADSARGDNDEAGSVI